MLTDSHIRLRALEPTDIEALYAWENLSDLWQYSCTLAPYSRRNMAQYIAGYQANPFGEGQLRLMIASAEGSEPRGLVDLYNVEVRHRRACVAILVAPEHQGRGIATSALRMLEVYCRRHLGLHQLLAAVPQGNEVSHRLFNKCGYRHIATLPQYVAGEREGTYEDTLIYNKILTSQGK